MKIAQLLLAMLLTEKMVVGALVLQTEYSKCNFGETYADNATMDSITILHQAYPKCQKSRLAPLKNLFRNYVSNDRKEEYERQRSKCSKCSKSVAQYLP